MGQSEYIFQKQTSLVFFFFHFKTLTMFQLYSNILVQGITIIAPVKSPNTDGINPGSSYKHQKNKCFDL